ncbi:unnamed protein product (macronuclear) [Paramecium tetraurelia]|uniref:PHD-type domain-containing protein n=1 Tax=Paramecium tetraurelia TaxID=5888 RepID=A0E015_PARTE|nr:uncharacterized protein GSPATT00021800001 [Paramecium tetraurelia]CAK88632.1 unnamed protein product [Paramecium tetraurelia]|eukprot:XP_001456029.1 hypothetical protein (macronuclear) [Paramecium tetraurelia strain d4-2]
MLQNQQSILNESFHFANLQQFSPIYLEFLKIFNSNAIDKLQNSNSLDQHIKTDLSLKNSDSQSSSPTQIHQTKKKCLNRNTVQPKQLQQQISCQNNNCQNKRKNLNETQINGQTTLLCNRCSINFTSNNYCEYCIQIYDPNLGYEMDDKQWIMCEKCNRWNHVECEQSLGKQNLTKITYQTKYQCSQCHKKIKQSAKLNLNKDTSQDQEYINTKTKQPLAIIKLTNKEIFEDISDLRTLLFDEKSKKVKIELNQ